MNELYRSPGYEPGIARRVGSVHFHVDLSGETNAETLVTSARSCERHGWPSKVTRVSAAARGPHIDDPIHAGDYAAHTPELNSEKPTFACYLTAVLSKESVGVESAWSLLAEVRRYFSLNAQIALPANSVVEVERVCCTIENAAIHVANPQTLSTQHNDSALFEVHHFVEVPLASGITFGDWVRECDQAHICVGGWFEFQRFEQRAFRSVRFARSFSPSTILDETRAVSAVASDLRGTGVLARTVVEQVLGMWRI